MKYLHNTDDYESISTSKKIRKFTNVEPGVQPKGDGTAASRNL
jgi:hypothetical protein